MFLKTGSPNGGIWFWDLPAGIRSNKEYSHSGTRCVEVYNRQTATGEFRVNLNTIRITASIPIQFICPLLPRLTRRRRLRCSVMRIRTAFIGIRSYTPFPIIKQLTDMVGLSLK